MGSSLADSGWNQLVLRQSIGCDGMEPFGRCLPDGSVVLGERAASMSCDRQAGAPLTQSSLVVSAGASFLVSPGASMPSSRA